MMRISGRSIVFMFISLFSRMCFSSAFFRFACDTNHFNLWNFIEFMPIMNYCYDFFCRWTVHICEWHMHITPQIGKVVAQRARINRYEFTPIVYIIQIYTICTDQLMYSIIGVMFILLLHSADLAALWLQLANLIKSIFFGDELKKKGNNT